MTASLLRRRVMLSLRRRIRCDHNQRNRGFLVVATARDSRAHVRITADVAARPRTCSATRLTVRAPAAVLASRGQS
ncbi:MAG: hypothetical protein ACRDMZ_05785 [Solirubrobacteraceae bacterium]